MHVLALKVVSQAQFEVKKTSRFWIIYLVLIASQLQGIHTISFLSTCQMFPEEWFHPSPDTITSSHFISLKASRMIQAPRLKNCKTLVKYLHSFTILFIVIAWILDKPNWRLSIMKAPECANVWKIRCLFCQIELWKFTIAKFIDIVRCLSRLCSPRWLNE